MTNSTNLLWKRSIVGSAVILSLALMLVASGPSGAKTADSSRGYRLSSFDAPQPVRAIVERACADCHSEKTKWPWYSNIPPVSWQIRADIDNARAVMDLSRWSQYTEEERHELASQIALSARLNVMPPAKYLWMHHDAKLSNADLGVLKDWARH